MDYSTVERTLIEKCAKDAGWEIGIEGSASCINVFSSFFKETAFIQKNNVSTFVLSLSRKLDEKYLCLPVSFDSDGDYIFSLYDADMLSSLLKRAAELYVSFPDNPLEEYKKKLADFSDAEIEKTEAERIVKERVGQDIYRNALIKYWQGACAVTGCTVNEALKASHAKPWKDCTSDAERLNVYNGFLLSANLDALFDKGYVSFTEEGKIMISASISSEDLQRLGIYSDMKLRWIEKEHLEFLDYHHKKVWKN